MVIAIVAVASVVFIPLTLTCVCIFRILRNTSTVSSSRRFFFRNNEQLPIDPSIPEVLSPVDPLPEYCSGNVNLDFFNELLQSLEKDELALIEKKDPPSDSLSEYSKKNEEQINQYLQNLNCRIDRSRGEVKTPSPQLFGRNVIPLGMENDSEEEETNELQEDFNKKLEEMRRKHEEELNVLRRRRIARYQVCE